MEINWLPPLWVQGRALPLFSLPGGQSGNPLSPHYTDLLPFWLEGRGVPIPWTREAVESATVETLLINPRPNGS